MLSLEADFSVLYLLDVLLGTLTNTLRCPGATETKGNASECRTRPHMVVAVLCLKYLRRQDAMLPSKTKEARDLVLTSDWLSGASMILVPCAKASRKFYD